MAASLLSPQSASTPEPRLSRRNWYLITNGVILCWILASVAGIALHQRVNSPLWLLVHLPLLGALTSAVLIWSQHFSDTLLRRPSPWGRPGLAVRLGLHTLGAIAVIFGLQTGTPALIWVGSIAVAVAAIVHGSLLARQRRGALVGRFAPLVKYYIVAAGLFVLGITAGGTLALGLAPEWANRLLLAHVILNIFGWLSVTALGTLVLLWPTVLHAKVPEGAEIRAASALWFFTGGILLAAAAALLGLMPLIAGGIALWLVGFGMVAWFGWREARAMPPGTFAGWSLAAAAGWLLVSGISVGVVGLISGDALTARNSILELLPPIVLGFAAQLLIGALSYLLPVLIIGSPSGVRAAAPVLDRFAALRVTALNVSLAAFIAIGVFAAVTGGAAGGAAGADGTAGTDATAWTAGARVALSVLVAALLLTFVVLVLLSVRVGRRARATELAGTGKLAAPGAPIALSLGLAKPATKPSQRGAVSLGVALPLACALIGAGIGAFAG